MKINLKSHPDKELLVHLQNVGNNCQNLLSIKKLNLSIIDRDILNEAIYYIGISHDFGKCTSFFQNKLNQNIYSPYSHHGLISALFGYILMKTIYNNNLLSIIPYIVIKKHHGNLESPLERIKLKNDLIQQLNDIEENDRYNSIKDIYDMIVKNNKIKFNDIFNQLKEIINNDIDDFIEYNFEEYLFSDLNDNDKIERFLLTNLIYSILIYSDKNDAAEINTNYFKNNLNEVINVNDYIENKVKLNITDNNEINKIRDEFFNDVKNNINININSYLYSLTAPTGIGKTFTAFAFANKIKELNSNYGRIIYCLPYTSIIDQNYDVLEDIIRYNINDNYNKRPTRYLLKHHYLTPLKLENDININNDSNNLNCFDQKLLLESYESANIITTFVQIFQSIIGNKNSYLLKFHNIINSIIILDEIQSLDVNYYKLIGSVFEILANKFNTYILFLTATQPKIINNEILIKLIDENKYYCKEEFNRVDLTVINKLEPINTESLIDIFKNNFKNNNSGLIICNKIKDALNIFKKINELYNNNYKIYSLTTNLIPIHRIKIINNIKKELKDKEKIIVISTQLVEAGVDFSFEFVFRDLAPIDSIIQAAGRANRNNELKPIKGRLFLYNYINNNGNEGNSIYDPKLIQDTKELLNNEYYNSKEFLELSRNYFVNINFQRESDRLISSIKNLNYSIIRNDETPIFKFQIIKDDDKEDIIICIDKEIDNKINKFIELIKLLSDINKYENDIIYEEYELLRKDLGNYKISLYENNLNEYKNIIKEFGNIKYVLYKDVDIIYNNITGFNLYINDYFF